MLEQEEESSAGGVSRTFNLPEEVLQILPSDPFEQLDVARKITSIALSTRVFYLESESSDLRAKLAEKEKTIGELQSQLESFDASLSETLEKLSRTEREKEGLLRDNASLSSLVKKLQRDVSKLEVFRKTLMQSLQEDEENSGTAQILAKPTPYEEDSSSLPSRYSSIRSQASDAGDSVSNDNETDVSRPSLSNNLLLASQTTTPHHLTPPISPPSLSASASPRRTSRPLSPRRNSVSFSTSRGMFDDRSSLSTSEAGSYTGRTRVDGKEFFRQVRSRLSYEQFGAFLANVKELNSHKQTREETLRKAEEIFGSDNKDLYVIFEGLVTRNVH